MKAPVYAFPGLSPADVLARRRARSEDCLCRLEPDGRLSSEPCPFHQDDLVPIRVWEVRHRQGEHDA